MRLCWYRRVLQEHWWDCAGTAEYYRSTWKAVLVLHSTIRALRVLVHSGGDSGTAEYYRNSGKAVLAQ